MGLELLSLQGRPGQVGSPVVLEELQGVRSVALAAERRGQGAGWGREATGQARGCVRCVVSGVLRGVGGTFLRKLPRAKKEVCLTPTQGTHPEGSYYLQ